MKKRKQYNSLKKNIAAARAILKHTLVLMSLRDTDGKAICWCMKKGQGFTPCPLSVTAIKNYRHRWTFLLVLRSLEKNGKERIVTEYQRMAADYLQADLVGHLNDAHQRLIAEEKSRGNEIIDAAWAASPVALLDGDALLGALNRIAEDEN
jgi:hypothetical protein